MLGILLVLFIGREYYRLADRFEKNKWLFGFLGIGVYYISTFIMGMLIAIIYEFLGNNIDDISDVVLGLIAIPFGLLGCWLVYLYLKNLWSKIPPSQSDLLDD